MDIHEEESTFHSIYDDQTVALACKCAHSVTQAINESFNLPKLPSWELSPWWYRASVTRNVELILYYNKTCTKLHNSWVKHMKDLGWTLGPVKDRDSMTRPDLVAYQELDAVNRIKNRAFRAAVVPFRKPWLHR